MLTVCTAVGTHWTSADAVLCLLEQTARCDVQNMTAARPTLPSILADSFWPRLCKASYWDASECKTARRIKFKGTYILWKAIGEKKVGRQSEAFRIESITKSHNKSRSMTMTIYYATRLVMHTALQAMRLVYITQPPSSFAQEREREREKCQLVYPAADFLPLYFRFPFSDTQKSHQKYNMESLVVEMTTGTTSKLFEASVAVFMRRDGSRQRDEKMENEKKKKKIVENPSSRPSFPFNCARYWRPATT